MAASTKKAPVPSALADADFSLAALSALAPRVVAFQRHMPARDAPVRQSMAEAVFDEARSIASDLLLTLGSLGARRRLATVELDFTLPDYAEFVRRERRIERALAKPPGSLFAFGAALPVGPSPSKRGKTADVQPQAADEADSNRKWVAKIFAAFGIGEAYQAVLEVLEADGILQLIARALRERDWSSLRTFLKMLADLLTSKPFFRKLAHKIGENAAAPVVGQVLGKCLPFVGWALLITGLVWAIVEQFL